MPERDPVLRNIRLMIEYDGTNFEGWQIQTKGRTVQGELARALEVLLKEPVRPTGAGRTDAGTHALGQVAHFHTHSDLSTHRILRSLNGLLPSDVAVLRAEDVPLDFHARYSARSKRYRYRIHMGKSALNRSQVWAFHWPLDLDAMQEAARFLHGIHDFGAFCKQDPVPENFRCRISSCFWERRGREFVFEIEADRFLRHMVRILVGTMTEIGTGRRSPGEMTELLRSGDRSQSGVTAPARGLCLVRVSYPDYP